MVEANPTSNADDNDNVAQSFEQILSESGYSPE